MKLKKLIVCGFKSFADRTEFDFDDGTSCIVGPNGCGKSNVVDAIKWVLGEQSAKSLRGAEMMDIIFNGSSARRPSGHAEVTMVFDNSSGLLKPVIEGEAANGLVSITRRLFRNGNSEYLINKTAARLRDIREMFMDTGVGVDAYSVIEQGKVESFLQASQEDRRSIFDEAAGISKYKARKKEALRKLERVDQNLLRINDVLQEVEKRLRSIKYQAGKARSYQSYTEQLKGLRSLYFLAQYHTLSKARTELQGQLDIQNDSLRAMVSRMEQLEASQNATEAEAADLERAARDVSSRMAAIGGNMTACQQRSEMLASRVKELAEQIITSASRCEELEAKLAQSLETLQQRQGELGKIEEESKVHAGRYETLRNDHTQGELGITRLTARLEDEKAGTIDLFRRTATLHNTIHGLGIRRENLSGQKNRLLTRANEIDKNLGAILNERGELDADLAEIRQLLAESQAKLDQTKENSRRVHDSEQQFQNQMSEAREQRSSVLARRKALGEMQQRLEGVGAGVRRVLEARRKGQLQTIAGMLGDFLQTDLEHAPLVEAALAGADQRLVAARLDDVRQASAELGKVLGENGSVEVLCLDQVDRWAGDFDPQSCPQVIARIMDWVKCDSLIAPALWRMLGKTLVVADLEQAALAARCCPPGTRFVTQAGEVLEADGRVKLGAGNRGAGVVMRRSELAELEARNAQLEAQIEQIQQQCTTARNERQHLEDLQQKLRTAIYESNTQRVECESRLKRLNEQVAQLERERPLIAGEVENIAGEIDAAIEQEHEARQKAQEMEQLSSERQKATALLEQEIGTARRRQQELNAQLTEMKVCLAQAEQRKLAIREALSALARQRENMTADLETSRSEIELNRQRRADADAGIAKAGEELARLAAELETLRVESQDLAQSRQGLGQKIEEIRRLLNGQRQVQEQATAKANTLRVELGEAEVRIESLISRAGDEMQMNLMETYANYQHEEGRDWHAVEEEIKDLRAKIERLGNVNLDAIPEQEELEGREKFLGTQLGDIQSSKTQLEELIRKINKESRDLFLETFETVRTNFQELFRKLFGGGRADILLINPDDVLESGIEIVARPPGKETRSLMLLSGGEKTMTALALLFSIFKSRPSPFCLLDEVDAALDEANNQRFNLLVSEFINTSQFIIISHSKRTMSVAKVLYGVTMQEPGVSKRISVRFEETRDVNEQLQAADA